MVRDVIKSATVHGKQTISCLFDFEPTLTGLMTDRNFGGRLHFYTSLVMVPVAGDVGRS